MGLEWDGSEAIQGPLFKKGVFLRGMFHPSHLSHPIQLFNGPAQLTRPLLGSFRISVCVLSTPGFTILFTDKSIESPANYEVLLGPWLPCYADKVELCRLYLQIDQKAF